MAAPATTARIEGGGIKLEDGYASQIAFAANDNINFWEKSVTPPGVDGGEPIESTTHFNTTWRTSNPRSLKTLTPGTMVGAYDPLLYDEIVALVNVEGAITVHFGDGSTKSNQPFLEASRKLGRCRKMASATNLLTAKKTTFGSSASCFSIFRIVRRVTLSRSLRAMPNLLIAPSRRNLLAV